MFCVDYKDLQKLLDSRREFVNLHGDYQRIYLSPKKKEREKYSKPVKRMKCRSWCNFSKTLTDCTILQAALDALSSWLPG